MKRSLHDPIVSTHALFLMNSALYIAEGFVFLSLVLLINTIASFLYHLSNETNKFWRKADHILCVISLAFIFSYLGIYSSGLEILGCVIWLVFSLMIYRTSRLDYEFWHALWHGCVFFGNVLVWYCLV